MKSEKIITNGQSIVFGLVMIIFIFLSSRGYAQRSKEISLSLYPGYTIVNFEKALNYSDDNLENWSEFHYSAALRGFLLSGKPIQFGAEFAWQRLYYGYYIVPYGTSRVYREFNVSTKSLMALARYSVNKFFAVGGAGIHFFNNGVSPAICLEAGYKISVGANLKLPVSLRINPVFGSGTPTPISAGIGFSYIINKRE
jgi:hypothetical protein